MADFKNPNVFACNDNSEGGLGIACSSAWSPTNALIPFCAKSGSIILLSEVICTVS